MSREAALLIGLIASVIAAAIEQLSGPGIIDKTNMGATIINVLTVMAPLIAGAFTRYQVFSKQSVADLTGTTPDTLPISPP